MARGYQQCIIKGISVFSYTAISANNFFTEIDFKCVGWIMVLYAGGALNAAPIWVAYSLK